MTRVGPVAVPVGVAYCVRHHGVLNEDDEVCDFARLDDDESECVSRPLFYLRGEAEALEVTAC